MKAGSLLIIYGLLGATCCVYNFILTDIKGDYK